MSEHLLHYLDTIKSPLWRIQLLALLSPRMRSITQERAKHQEEVMQIVVLTALPSAQISAVLATTQLDVQSLYHDLSAGYETPLLQQFAEALNVPLKKLAPMGKRVR